MKKMWVDENEMNSEDNFTVAKSKDYWNSHGKNKSEPVYIRTEAEERALKDPFANVREEFKRLEHLDKLLSKCETTEDPFKNIANVLWVALKKDIKNFDKGAV